MQLPNLPTDNLYKFVALTGLILFVLATASAIIVPYHLHMQFLKLNSDMAILCDEQSFLIEKMKSDNEGYKSYCEYLETVKKRKSKKRGDKIIENYFDSDSKEFLAITEKRDQTILEVRKKRLLIEHQTEVLKYLERETPIVFWVCFALSNLGIIMSAMGFIFWYKRHQVYQDRIIKKEAEKKE